MGYQAGNLELSLLGYSDKAVNSINATTKALRSLSRVIKNMESVNFSFAGQKLEALFTKIARATNSINTTNITNLASAAKSLSSITRLSNLEKMDFEKVGKGFNTLAVAIQPFLDRVKEAEASLTALDGVLRRSSGKKIQGLLGVGATDNKKSEKVGFLGFAKLGVNIYMMRRLGRFMMNLVQAGSDYNETLNLWQVAMRNNLDVADQFVNKMQKAYGISTKTLMNAQAVFKNMIGSLGQISDQTAYALSEALVQMSADYASLYNRTLESAFKNMQSMLAGQVRPIRSAGLDMTETTLFMFYQQLGGTKTMRQLNRTEKQLLSILAVYQQMGSAGALGDMSKTLNQFANQSRMMTEYWAELKTWSGLLLKDLIDDWGILVKINALLITATEVVKAIAKSRGVGDENYLTGLFETTEATNDAVDELQGKLLDFDKFRSLEGAGASPLAIDEKLLQAISGYSSKIDQAENAAQQLAETWLGFFGITKNANGEFEASEESLSNIQTILDGIVILVGALFSFGIVAGIGRMVSAIKTAIAPFKSIFSEIAKFINTLKLSHVTIAAVTAGIVLLIANVALLAVGWEKMNTLEKVIGIFGAIGAAALVAAAAVAAFHGSWTMGTAAVAIVGGLLAIAGAFSSFKATMGDLSFFANGASDIDGGTMFVAGEMGKTEAVYNGSNGKTNVANVKQMQQAFYNALVEYGSNNNGDNKPIVVYLDGETVYQNTTARAKARGKTWANV